jgi:microsomal prostaglandin-E synthase 2
VRAFLDYTNIPWTAVEVEPLRKPQMNFTSYKKVPVMIVNDEQLNDSMAIIEALHKMLPDGAKKPHVPSDPAALAEIAWWNVWVNQVLVHLLVANLYRTWGEAMQAFDYLLTHGNFSHFERTTSRYAGAVAMYSLSHLVRGMLQFCAFAEVFFHWCG